MSVFNLAKYYYICLQGAIQIKCGGFFTLKSIVGFMFGEKISKT